VLEDSSASVYRDTVEAAEIAGEVGTNPAAKPLWIHNSSQMKLAVMPLQKHPHAFLVVGVVKSAQTLTVGDKENSPYRRIDSVYE
jgi:hypothetical protein